MQKYRAKGDPKHFFFATSPSIAMLCSRKVGKTANFCHSILSTIYHTKKFRATLEFINAHLQHQDQITTVLCTVD